MGCWNETCAVTHLPITMMEPMMVIPLIGSGMSTKVTQHDTVFEPLSFPFRSTYNDYGGIESIDKSDELILKKQLIRHGIMEQHEIEHKWPEKGMVGYINELIYQGFEITGTGEYPDNVDFMFVREDVYKMLIREMGGRRPYKNKKTIEYLYAKKLEKGLNEIQKERKIWKEEKIMDYKLQEVLNRFGRFNRFGKMFKELQLLDSTISMKGFIGLFAEMAVFGTALNWLRMGYLSPTSGAGSQLREMDLHRKLAELVIQITDKEIEEYNKSIDSEEIQEYTEEHPLRETYHWFDN